MQPLRIILLSAWEKGPPMRFAEISSSWYESMKSRCWTAEGDDRKGRRFGASWTGYYVVPLHIVYR
jgi:hypothetical protein